MSELSVAITAVFGSYFSKHRPQANNVYIGALRQRAKLCTHFFVVSDST